MDHTIINNMVKTKFLYDYTFVWLLITEPAILERKPVNPAKGPPACSGASGTDVRYALRNSSLT